MSVWDSEDKLAELEAIREKHRFSGKRLSFDCLNMIVATGGEKAHCRMGRIPSVSLLSVLRGVCYAPCKACPYWSTEYIGGQK